MVSPGGGASGPRVEVGMSAVATTQWLLRDATPGDLAVVLGWLAGRDQLQTWGLPAAGFQAGADWVWRAIGGAQGDTWALVDSEDRLAGFGQAVPEGPDSVHLNRIVVAPGLRGLGLGRQLCLELMARAGRHRPRRFTLKVFQENAKAVALFRSLGFVECPAASSANLIFMERLATPGPGDSEKASPGFRGGLEPARILS